MEKIDRISFFNMGVNDKSGSDFFDTLKPGIVVLFGEEKNFIGEYDTKNDNSKIINIKTLDAFDDYVKLASEFFISNYGIKDELLMESLVKSADEEDQDGFYEYLEKNKGEVIFGNPNDKINDEVKIYMVKQMAEGNFECDGEKILIDNSSHELKDLGSGYFDDNHEIVVYLK